MFRPPFPGQCRERKEKKLKLTLDLHHPYQLVFEPCGDGGVQTWTDGVDWKTVKAIRILDVEGADA